MITSHRDRRAFQNYGYFSRSFLFCQMKSSNLGKRIFAQDNVQAVRFGRLGKVWGADTSVGIRAGRPPKDPQTIQILEYDMFEDHILGVHVRT